jgi:glycosyltransferase involved in cell wall biosynthesis
VRIGIDARELCGQPTGVGRYLSGLLQQWASGEAAHEYVLYAHQELPSTLAGLRFRLRVVPGGGGTRWEQMALPRALAQDRPDVFFAPGYTAPLLTRVPRVVAIHDVSFAAHPEWFGAREGFRRRVLTRRAAAAARAVTTLSEFSRQELIDRLNVAPGKIHIVRPGVTAPVQSPRPASAREARVLYVGSIFNRRHVPDLIRAVALLAREHRDVGLDIVGGDRSYPPEHLDAVIERERAHALVRWHRYVSDAELARLYSGARAFAFLSEYEGLGLTPLEALAAGLPPVLLDTPVARESCGEAARYVPRGDVAAAASALASLLFDEDARTRLLAAAPTVLARYDWRQAASRTLAVLEGAP